MKVPLLSEASRLYRLVICGIGKVEFHKTAKPYLYVYIYVIVVFMCQLLSIELILFLGDFVDYIACR